MKRLAALLLLAGLAHHHAGAIDPRVVVVPAAPLPTSPQVPQPVIQQVGGVLPAPAAPRVAAPIRERSGYLSKTTSSPAGGEMPLPTGYTLVNTGTPGGPACDSPAGCPSCGGGSRSCLSRLKAWLCFHPTSGDALPKLRPLPYQGPVVGIFPCTSGAGCGSGCGPTDCAGAANCARGGRAGSLLTGRGSRGECVSPADDVIPGYRFAPTAQSPAPVSVYAQPTAQTSPRPTVAAPVQQAVFKPVIATPAQHAPSRPVIAPPAVQTPPKPAATGPVTPASYKPATTTWTAPSVKPSADPSARPLTRP